MVDELYIMGRKILYNELQPLFEVLSSVDYAVVKGEVLSQQIYGMPNKRKSSDIDILIDKKNISMLENELQKLGFKQKLLGDAKEVRHTRVLCMTYSHQVPSYSKEKLCFNLNVDLNHDIFWGEYEGQRCSIIKFLEDTVEMDIYGVIVKTLPVEKAFVQLILHHYKEMNSIYYLSQNNYIRTHKFQDVYDMIINNKKILMPEKLRDLCEKYLIGSYIYYMIYYTNQVFPNGALNDYLKKIESFRDDRLIECYGLASREMRKWSITFDKRLNKDNLWQDILKDMSELDLQKIEINKNIFL